MNLTPEQALNMIALELACRGDGSKVKPEYVWSVVHHEYGTWVHLDVFDLNKQPTKPARKYTRKERYRFCAIISLPVGELILNDNSPYAASTWHPAGRCKSCTEQWRSLEGYGSEDDLDAIDDLPFYLPKERM